MGNQYVNFYPLNIEHAKLPSWSGGVAEGRGGCLSNPQSAIPNPKSAQPFRLTRVVLAGEREARIPHD